MVPQFPGPNKNTVHLRVQEEANEAGTLVHIRGRGICGFDDPMVGHDFTKKERICVYLCDLAWQ